jgi:hypothetical protein
MAMESQVMEHFKDLPDPRMVNKCDHLLIDIVMIAICATIANADSWEDIAAFGEGKRAWLGQSAGVCPSGCGGLSSAVSRVDGRGVSTERRPSDCRGW